MVMIEFKPSWLSLLPCFLLAGCWLTPVSNELSRKARACLVLPLALSIAQVTGALLSHLTHALGPAWWISSALCLVGWGGCLIFFRTPRYLHPIPTQSKKTESAFWDWSYALLSVALTFWIGKVAWQFFFHDQMRIQGHATNVESFLRGNLPPGLISFPHIPLKYHYGSDFLSAIFAYLGEIPAYRGIDLNVIAGTLGAMGALYALCCLLKIRGPWKIIVLLWTFLGAGWVYLLQAWIQGPGTPPGPLDWPDSHIVFYRNLNPATLSNFFMNPYSAGLAFFFAYLAVFFTNLRQKSKRLGMAAIFLLASLSFTQVTFFLLAGFCSGVVLLIEAFRHHEPWKKQAMPWGSLVLSCGLALLLGGFFSFSRAFEGSALAFHWPPGFLSNATWGGKEPLSAAEALLWYFCTFGSWVILSPILFVVLTLKLKRNYEARLFYLLLLAGIAFLIPQFFHYTMTWDIIKFFTSFQLMLPLLLCSWVSEIKPPRKILTFLLVPLLFLDIFSTAHWLHSLAFRQAQEVKPALRRWYKNKILPPTGPLEEIITQLKAQAWPSMVLAPMEVSEMLARLSGQAMAQWDHNTWAFRVNPETLKKRTQLIKNLEQNFSENIFLSSPVEWIIYPCEDFQKNFSEISQHHLEDAVELGLLKHIQLKSPHPCWEIFQRSTPASRVQSTP